MARYSKHPPCPDGWSQWLKPKMRGYRIACCDCALVHEFRFMIYKGTLLYRVRRHERATAAKRRERRKARKGKR